VVLLVLGILAAIATPTFNRVKENSVTRVAQTTLEAAARNGEAIAASDRNATDEDIAAAVASEFTDTDVLTVSVGTGADADKVTVSQTNGSITASGSVKFNGGVAVITDATISGGGGSPTTTVAPVSYSVGDTGPAGGVIFYVAGTPFACGPTLAQTCTYLEAAPAVIASPLGWCSDNSTSLGVTATAIGTGMANTTTAAATCTSGAIQEAADYSSGGFSDWFLPSKDELNELYLQRATVGGPTGFLYWSSSEYSLQAAWLQYFSNGEQINYLVKYAEPGRLRPVRAF
jgi:Tfp pilus assembly protein PilE